MNFGICLAGIEEQFERALLEHAKAVIINHFSSPVRRFHYVEIGTAGAETFLAVEKILRDSVADYFMTGIDPSEEAKAAYDRAFENNHAHSNFFQLTRDQAFQYHWDAIGNQVDFVFIDGCHSRQCVMGDFLAIEPLVVPGGMVVLHDIEDEPGDLQPHCNNSPRGVREGLQDLGLWQNNRPGWNRLPDWQCDKTKNAFSCAVFEKL